MGPFFVCYRSSAMRIGTWLLISSATVWSVFLGATGRDAGQSVLHEQAASVVPADASAPASSSDYLGSASCRRCHEDSSDEWERSLHVRMTKPVADALVVGDFSDGRRFQDHGRSYTFGRKDGRPFVTIAFGDRAPETFNVDYTLGAKRYQGYLSKLPDGRIYVLPIFWHIESGRWLDWKEITPIPDNAHDLRQIWNANCFNCHGTNIVQGYDIATKQYNSTWTEMGIGCEACHGPGREHVALMDGWEKDPATKPAYDNSRNNRGLSEVLKTFSPRSADPRRTYDTCSYCHGNKTNVFVGFRAGSRYEDYALPFVLSDEIPANDFQGEFWPDGRPNRFNRPQALTLSGCFQAGAVTCTSCHVAHGSKNEHSLKVNIYQGRNGDGLCTQCHSAPKRLPETPAAAVLMAGDGTKKPVKPSFAGAGLEAHTFHEPASAGSRCISCHMSDVNWRLLIRRRDHTFQAPNPAMTARYGVPNACTTCHDDKTPEWATAQMDAWWGDGERRAKALGTADVMYRAGSGDGTVIPDLARLAVDRSQGSVMRASAVDYIARMLLGGNGGGQAQQSQTSFGGTGSSAARRAVADPASVPPEVVNVLIGAAADPEPIVRAAAVKGLAATGPLERILPPLVARLNDDARVVRVKAAEALLMHGVVTLDGRPGELLARAQDELADSLQQFPDVASNHASRGWLEAERGHLAEARQALDDAIAVEPRFARPYIVKGVIAARAERYDEAIDLWKKARAIEPEYPRVNELIAEAEKRKKAGAP